MVAFLTNPPPPSPNFPRLYLLVPHQGEAGNPATGGVLQACWDNYSAHIASLWDAYIAAGSGRGLYGVQLMWARGRHVALQEHTIGLTPPAPYPVPSSPITCTPHNHATHLAEVEGNGQFVSQIVPAWNTPDRKGKVYDIIEYKGALHESSPTDAATLDAESAHIRALGGTPAHDADAVLDNTQDTPHRAQLRRLRNVHGLRPILESWEVRGISQFQEFRTLAGGNAALSSSSNPFDTNARAGTAITFPDSWETYPTLAAMGLRAHVIMQHDSTSEAVRTETADFWRRRGCDVWLDIQAGFGLAAWVNLCRLFDSPRPRPARPPWRLPGMAILRGRR